MKILSFFCMKGVKKLVSLASLDSLVFYHHTYKKKKHKIFILN